MSLRDSRLPFAPVEFAKGIGFNGRLQILLLPGPRNQIPPAPVRNLLTNLLTRPALFSILSHHLLSCNEIPTADFCPNSLRDRPRLQGLFSPSCFTMPARDRP